MSINSPYDTKVPITLRVHSFMKDGVSRVDSIHTIPWELRYDRIRDVFQLIVGAEIRLYKEDLERVEVSYIFIR